MEELGYWGVLMGGVETLALSFLWLCFSTTNPHHTMLSSYGAKTNSGIDHRLKPQHMNLMFFVEAG